MDPIAKIFSHKAELPIAELLAGHIRPSAVELGALNSCSNSSQIVTAIEADEQVKVVVFDSAVEGFFLNHSDFVAKLEIADQPASGTHGAQGVAGHLRAHYACARSCQSPRSVAARQETGASSLLPAT